MIHKWIAWYLGKDGRVPTREQAAQHLCGFVRNCARNLALWRPKLQTCRDYSLPLFCRVMFHAPKNQNFIPDHVSHKDVASGGTVWRWIDFRDPDAWEWIEGQLVQAKTSIGDLVVGWQAPATGKWNEHNQEGRPDFYTDALVEQWSRKLVVLTSTVFGANHCLVNLGIPVTGVHLAIDLGYNGAFQDNVGETPSGQGETHQIWHDKIPQSAWPLMVHWCEPNGPRIDGIGGWVERGIPLSTIDDVANKALYAGNVFSNMGQQLTGINDPAILEKIHAGQRTLVDNGGMGRFWTFVNQANGTPTMTKILWAGQKLFRRHDYSDELPWGPVGTATGIDDSPVEVDLTEGDRFSLTARTENADGEPFNGWDADSGTLILEERYIEEGAVVEVLFTVLDTPGTAIGPAYGSTPPPDPPDPIEELWAAVRAVSNRVGHIEGHLTFIPFQFLPEGPG